MSDRTSKRSKTDLYASILDVVRRYPGGGRITKVSYGVGVPLDRLRVMFDDLIAYGLLKRAESEGETRYACTPRGAEFLETYWKMNGYLEAFEEKPTRGLAAIMFSDIVGFTALTQKNEGHALQLLEEYRALTRRALAKYKGREVKTMGDGFIVEFTSALEASECAVEIQRLMQERNMKVGAGDKLWARIGIHVGDVERKGSDILGDAVNIASRVYSFADAGGICITRQVFDQIWNKIGNHLTELGKRDAKNLDSPIDLFAVDLPWSTEAPRVER